MRKIYLFAFSFLMIGAANAAPINIVVCPAGEWDGSTMLFNQIPPDVKPDQMGLPETSYIITNPDPVMLSGGKTTPIYVVHNYKKYVVVSYIYGGVHYTDTLFDSGLVVTQYVKEILVPMVFTAYKMCKAV